MEKKQAKKNKKVKKPVIVHYPKKFTLFFLSVLIVLVITCIYFLWNSQQQAHSLYFDNVRFPTPTSVPTLIEDFPTETPVPSIIADPHPQQSSCPQGFYYFENEVFSVCYPNILTPYVNQGPDYNFIALPDSEHKSELDFLPQNEAAGGSTGHDCITREKSTVSGVSVIREIHRDILQNGCGDINEMITNFLTDKEYPFAINYEAFVGGSLPYLKDYPIIEQSLRIKKF